MHLPSLNGKLALLEVILVAGSFYFWGICICGMRELFPCQVACISGGVRGWLLFPKHLGFLNGSAKYCCYYRGAKINRPCKILSGPSYKRLNSAERAGYIYSCAISCPRELEVVADKGQMKGWRRDANIHAIDGGDTWHTSCWGHGFCRVFSSSFPMRVSLLIALFCALLHILSTLIIHCRSLFLAPTEVLSSSFLAGGKDCSCGLCSYQMLLFHNVFL